MFVNWAHYLIPKCSFVLAYLSNPLFIWLISSKNNNVLIGNYRYLLFFFAVFNMIASLADLLVPVCVHGHRYASVTFLADGPFSSRSEFGESSIAYRCAFISGTYGILNVHFLFRYLVLIRSHIINNYFMPWGLISSIFYVLAHMALWAFVVKNFIFSAPEMRDYVRESFRQVFHENIDDINFVGALFSETRPDIAVRSWAGVLLLTLIASYSMVLYFVLGYKIVTGLNLEASTMSAKTAEMQRQLFKALTIQTVIPICVSFMPCTLGFYGAAFKIDFMNWVYWGACIAVSMFPFLDPMAIIFFLPALRRRLRIGGQTTVSAVSNTVSNCPYEVSNV